MKSPARVRGGRWIVPFVACLYLWGASPAVAQKSRISRLENGLDVILRPVAGTDRVALVVLYAVGGDHDPGDRSGLAHLIEHIYITAAAGETKARTAGEVAQRYPRAWNAQTGAAYTVFANVFPEADLDGELNDAAARMGDLRVEASDLDRERSRLLKEVSNMFGGMPALAARNLAGEKVRPAPLGGRKGGLPEDVAAITVDEVRSRWEKYYKPFNATIVLAGAIDPEAARKAIALHFGSIPAGVPAPKPAEPGKPVLGGIDEVAVASIFPAAPSTGCLAFRAPSPASELYAPFLVAVARLIRSMGQGGRPPGQPRSVEVGFAPLDDPGKIYLMGLLEPDEPAKEAVERLRKFVAKGMEPETGKVDRENVKGLYGFFLWTDTLPDAMLRQNLYGVAFAAGRRAQLGIDPKGLDGAIGRVTTEDLRRVGKEIFSPERGAAVVVLPK